MDRVSKQIEINAPVKVVFDLFSNFNHLPRWMKGVKKVERVTEGRTHWTVEAPDGTLNKWTTEVTDLEPEQHVAWHSTGDNIEAEGEASFTVTERGTTMMRLTLGRDIPPQSANKLIGEEHLEQRLEEDLIWFRLLVERETRTDSAGSAPRVTAAPLLNGPANQLAGSLPNKSAMHFATFSAIRRAGQVIRPARLSTGVMAANQRRASYAPIVVNLDNPVDRRSDEDTTVLTKRSRATVPAPFYRPVLAGVIVLGLLFVTSASWIAANKWPINPDKQRTEPTTTDSAAANGVAQHDQPAAVAGIEPTATFEPDGALPAAATEESLSPKAGTTKAQQKASGKRLREKRSATRWLTGWLKPVIKPFTRKKGGRRR